MTRKLLFSSALIAAISATFLLTSCEKEQLLVDEPDAAVTRYIPANFNVYNITENGTYIIQGTVKGQYIDVKASDVTIKGVGANPTFEGKGYSGQARSASHIRGGGTKLTIKDFTFVGRVGHNFMRASSNNTLIQSLTVYNNTKDGAGAINPGKNSMVRNCFIEPHDDAIKITEPNSKAEDNECVMDGNGSVIQLGWGNRADGAVHYATNTKISGYLRNNGQTNTCGNPGRSIIGGIFENNTSDIKITQLDINMSSQHNGHYVKLGAFGATVQDIEISGVIRNTVSVAAGIKPVALATHQGGTIKDIVIDFGNKIKANHVYSDNGVKNLTIGGGSSGPCDNNPAPTGSIVKTDYNASGHGRVIVSASDNSAVVKVEVFKGNTSMGALTAPNAGENYRIVNDALNSGDSFTVVISDDCNATKTLNGTMP